MLGMGEWLLRQVLEPIDYLRPSLQKDDILKHKIAPYSSFHDAWGFRNLTVPNQADVVALGDSTTYGEVVPRAYSWPAVLQEETRHSVYNLGISGYGPVHYFYLLKNKAFLLKPKIVITMVSVGTDLMDAFQSAYLRPYWQYLRNPNFHGGKIEDNSQLIFGQPEKSHTLFASVRQWLSQQSVLYNLVKNVLEQQVQHLRVTQAQQDSRFTVLKTDRQVLTLVPQSQLEALNLQDEKIQEGLRISLQVLLEMQKLCKQNQVNLLIALLPTKEIIYSEYLEQQANLPHSQTIKQILENERKIIETFLSFFKQHEISFVDLGSALKAEREKHTLYPIHSDAHPNREGYAVIAKILAKSLKENFQFP